MGFHMTSGDGKYSIRGQDKVQKPKLKPGFRVQPK